MEHLRDKLAKRLRALMDASPTLDTQTKVSRKANVSQSTVQRILSRDVAATVDVVEDLGKAFGLRPPSLMLADESEAQMLQAWLGLGAAKRDEVRRYALSLNESETGSRLNFEVRVESGPARQAANVRASARAIKNDEQNECLPTRKTSKTQAPAKSSESATRKPRTRSA